MLLLIGKILLLLIFFSSGISKIQNFKGTISGFKNVFIKKLPNFVYSLIMSFLLQNIHLRSILIVFVNISVKKY